jgi:hypothetical protein
VVHERKARDRRRSEAPYRVSVAADLFEANEKLSERYLSLADDDEGGAGAKVRLGAIGGVVAGHNHRQSSGVSLPNDRNGGLAHARQAHLGEPVERIVVEHDDVRALAVERAPEAGRVDVEHRIVEGCRMAQRAYVRGGEERRERRVGLADRVLLRVMP